MEGLPDAEHPGVRSRMPSGHDTRAVEGMAAKIRETWRNGEGSRVTLVSTGPMTNIALFVSVYPEVLVGIDQFVFMGGGVGLGNRSAVAGTSSVI